MSRSRESDKTREQKLKILVLCHGGRWVLTDTCPTMGVPITPDAITAMTFVSSHTNANPHIVADWTQPTRIARHRFDVVTTACCGFDTFLDATTGALCSRAFRNVVRVLKPGGYFIFTTAPAGEKVFAAHIMTTDHVRTPPSAPQVLARLAAEIQAQHPDLQRVANTSAAVRRWTSDLARRYDRYYRLPPDLLLFRHVMHTTTASVACAGRPCIRSARPSR